MPDAPFQPQLGFSPHNNQSLFSDHYLQEILRRTPAWRDLQTPAAEFLAWLRDLYAREREQLTSYNESQLEDNWIKPILDRLGHVWEGQASIPALTRNIKKPDFALFPDEAARQTAVPHQNTPHYVQNVLALLEAKKWTVNLSKKSGPLPIFDDQNPMYQIDTYLSLSGLTWGVVSNGRFWRLVHKNSSRTLETYFEIDLLAALHAPDETTAGLAVATFFWAFFNQSAFLPDAHGRTFLDEALSQSKAYAIALEADLRDNAYRSLEQLIIGFFAGDGRLDPQNADHRAQVYQNSLYLLYRLLFLFYGEARALLPMGNPTYKDEYSLQTLANDINRERDRLDGLPSTGRRHWGRLQELFRLISGQDAQFNAELGVPRYNGGLFDPQQHPFLETHFVGDRGLAKAIDYLAYRRVREDGRFQGYQSVDYRTLDVRQLGSIYEGLLEYKVAVATEEMVTVRQKGVETWLPARQSKAAPLDRRQPGELYLTNDKGERKATGSYYTPDYIVEYIVANTLGPLVEQARERVKAQVRQTGSLNEAERQRQSAHLFVQEILALNVLDPAMGSGHFLVEATHFLARALATDEYVIAEGSGRSPTVPDALRSGASGTVGTPATADAEETDLLYWKRRVVEACIYGVDKNPMAVELAKLSLWLKTAAADKPLSFLDHHLQHGDSLIGAWLDDLQAAPGSRPQGFAKGSSSSKSTDSKPLGSEGSEVQQPLFDDSAFTRDASLAVGGVLAIERATTNSIDDVHLKEQLWRELQQTHIGRWQRLADLWVSAYFGNTMTPEEYRALAAQLQGQESLLSETQLHHFLQHPAVTGNDYFHWELAFPEVFFDEYGRSRHEAAGFDAVIGNPPYVRIQRLEESITKYFLDKFEACSKKTDLSVAFLERGFDLVSDYGTATFISSSQWMSTDYGQATRKYLSDGKVARIVDFGSLPVFDEVSTYPAIFVLSKDNSSELLYGKVHSIPSSSEELSNIQFSLKDYGLISDDPWVLDELDLRSIILRSETQEINQWGHFYIGALTGMDSVFVVSNETVAELGLEHDLLLPYAYRGEEVNRYGYVNPSKMVIYPYREGEKGNAVLLPEKELQRNYPNTFAYLLSSKAELSERLDSRKKYATGENWFCFLRPGRFDYILPEKLIIQGVANQTCVGFLDKNTVFNGANTPGLIFDSDSKMVESLLYLLSLVNSRLISSYLKQVCPSKLHGYTRFNANNLNEIPIRVIDFATDANKRSLVVNTAKTHYEQGNTAALLAWATAELAANRSDTIHDLLAHLAEQMIALNQQKQAALEAFWLDLEGVTDPKPFDTLRHKGKHQASLHKNVPAMRPFVAESSRSTITLDATLGWHEDAFKGMVKELVGTISGLSKFVQVYRDHAPSVTALNQRLTTTDHLIDQIVYKLYNLTPEEIAIVEAKP